MIKEFRDFIGRGNVIDLAVAVVIGAAFGAVVASFTNDILMQIVSAVFGEPDFSVLSFTINGSEIRYGAFLTAVTSFLIIAFAIFLIVKLYNSFQSEEAEEYEPTEVDLLKEIRDSLRS